MKKVYKVQVEVVPLDGCEMPERNVAAIVNIFIGASTIHEAIYKTERSLLLDRYDPVDTYGAFELHLDEMEDADFADEEIPGKDEMLAIQENGGIYYGPFLCFPLDNSMDNNLIQ